jgi:hypothetical protein
MKLGTAFAALHTGAWSSATAYVAGQIVSSAGASYVCILAHTNQTPPNATYWKLLASINPRAVVTKTTGSLANLAEATGTVDLGKSFLLLKITVDRDARVRLYSTAAARTADSARTFGTDPTPGTQHGVICDVLVTAADGLVWILSPQAPGSCMEASVTRSIPYAIQNVSGSTSTVQVNFTVVETEI